jgi:hypothetical protein
MKWKSKEAEELYKTTVRWVAGHGGKSSKVQLTLKIFIDDLKGLEMVGYETWHAQFEDIRDVLGIRAFNHPALRGSGMGALKDTNELGNY